MLYDFDKSVARQGTASSKWDGRENVFGRRDVVPLWVADMDFKSPEPVIAALQARVAHGVFGYTIRTPELLEAIQGWFARRHGWHIDPTWIQYAQGVVNGLSLVVRAFTRPEDGVIVQPPVYPPFFSVVRDQGRKLIENPLRMTQGGRYEMDFDDLEAKAKAGAKMLLLCSPHNPVGRVWTREELMQVGDICRRHGVLVVADEIHCDFVYAPHRHVPFASISEAFAESSITWVAPSKTFNLAGFHSACAIIPSERLRSQFAEEARRSSQPGADVLGTVAMEAAYRYGDEWLDQLLAYLAENLAYLRRFVEESLPGLAVNEPEGTYLAWLDCRGLGLDDDALRRFFIDQAGVGLNPGPSFGTGGHGFQRLNFGCPRKTLMEGLNGIRRAVGG